MRACRQAPLEILVLAIADCPVLLWKWAWALVLSARDPAAWRREAWTLRNADSSGEAEEEEEAAQLRSSGSLTAAALDRYLHQTQTQKGAG